MHFKIYMRIEIKYQSVICVLALGLISPLAQRGELKLDAARPKITTVSAMRARRAPQITVELLKKLERVTAAR